MVLLWFLFTLNKRTYIRSSKYQEIQHTHRKKGGGEEGREKDGKNVLVLTMHLNVKQATGHSYGVTILSDHQLHIKCTLGSSYIL